MRLLAVMLLVTSAWIVLAAVLNGCARRRPTSPAGPSGNVFAGEYWLWEQRDGMVRLREEASLPESAPVEPRC